MVIGIVLAAMAASISTTAPRTTAASSSTEPGLRDYLLYRALAHDNDWGQSNSRDNITAADNYNKMLLTLEGGREERGDQRRKGSRYAGASGDPPAERRKPRREQGATLHWRDSNTTNAQTLHTGRPSGRETPGDGRERCTLHP